MAMRVETNPLEANSIFPNPDSCLRLVFALLAKLDDEQNPQGRSQLQPVTRTS